LPYHGLSESRDSVNPAIQQDRRGTEKPFFAQSAFAIGLGPQL
jgi:hypothetical protein